MCILCKDYIQVNIVTEEAARQVKLTESRKLEESLHAYNY
jgi:hypothetical protein